MVYKHYCGYYHYSLEHFFEVHGQSQALINPYIKVPFTRAGKQWNEEEYDNTYPYPPLTYKWVCQFCGMSGANKKHAEDCEFRLEYPEFVNN